MVRKSPDVSVLVMASRQAQWLHATLVSVEKAVANVRSEGRSAEVCVVCYGDDVRTRQWLEEKDRLPVIHVDTECPGQARNEGIAQVGGRHVAILEGGDLWSGSFVQRALKRAEGRNVPEVWRAAASVGFADSYFDAAGFSFRITPEHATFSPDAVQVEDPFPPSFLAERSVLESVPFPLEDADKGWGKVEHWWSANLAGLGIAQRPVPETLHYFRSNQARPGKTDLRLGPTTLEAGRSRG